ncbi:MAG: hypothetical protein K2V38_15710 [Gemmataceae bacterium]|nr:hypothetical protein [Gemmataceae bacterium]
MKSFALAALTATSLFLTAGQSDAQFRRGFGYSTYSYPSYGYNSPYYGFGPSYYAAPAYNGVVGIGSYAPLGGTVIQTGGVPVVTPGYGYSTYSYPGFGYSNFGYTNYGYGTNVGGYRRGWRW